MIEPNDVEHCPVEIELAAFAEGALEAGATRRVAQHLARCSECREAVAFTTEFLREGAEPEVPVRRRGWPVDATWRRAAAAVLLLVSIAAATWRFLSPPDLLAPVRRAAAASPVRPVEGWVAGFDHAPFKEPRSTPTSRPSVEMLAATEEVEQSTGSNARVLHARGVAALFAGDHARAVTLLQQAAHAAPTNAGYWSDLAAAQLALGSVSTDTTAFRQAVAAADRSIALSPSLAAAHFNRAAALDRLGRRGEATASYRRALAVEPPAEWRAEIFRRMG